MNFSNPTQLKLGQSGIFFNKTYRIIGRAVLGIFEDGAAYYWNEFYMESAGAKPAILVFEETETGPAWRLFMMFDPVKPMTAEEAMRVKVGDIVEVDESRRTVTRVDHSRVVFIEGRTPEGISPGKTATYFNASFGDQQLVVSWTGDQVEFYSGTSTSTMMVASAFKLEGFAAKKFVTTNGRSWSASRFMAPILISLVLIGLATTCIVTERTPRANSPVALTAAPKSDLKIGHPCTVNNTVYQVVAHRQLDMDETGRRWKRDEFDLTGSGDFPALLAHEDNWRGPMWIFYEHITPEEKLTPQRAALLPAGTNIDVNGERVHVQELFRTTVRSNEGASSNKVGEITYGFVGTAQTNAILLVRWNETNIQYFRGTPFSVVK